MKTILSVGFECPGGFFENLPLDSPRSLLDADIVIFQPGIPGHYFSHTDYAGKPKLSEHGSSRAVEQAAHWRSELRDALAAGKTIIVFLSKPLDVYVYTGEKQFSGTGRSRTHTNIVAEFSSYRAIPIQFKELTPKSGEVIVPARSLGVIASYWHLFSQDSNYEVYFEADLSETLLTTKTGNKKVGGIINSAGSLILLPPIDTDREAFTKDDGDDQMVWTPAAKTYGKKLVSAIVEIDKAARAESARSPVPPWALDDIFRLKTETAIENQIKGVIEEMDLLQTKRLGLQAQLEVESGYRRLLFEQGHELEAAIVDALKLMGFHAEPFKDGDSEFDAVFQSPEGRFLGEAEGKDTKAINIDKLSQLERNIQEDFARDEVANYAQGVLFGNAYRLESLEDRKDFFTEKCLSGAKRSGVALVRTPDLFTVARYLRESADADFAKLCRSALATTNGELVVFPAVPLGGS